MAFPLQRSSGHFYLFVSDSEIDLKSMGPEEIRMLYCYNVSE